MAFQTFNPPLQPSIGSGVQWNARLIENSFGDGYRQTAKDGLNAVVGTFTVSWELLNQDQANYIDGFLKNNVGTAFWWTTTRTPTLLWDCKSWTRDAVAGANDKISASFTERFDLG